MNCCRYLLCKASAACHVFPVGCSAEGSCVLQWCGWGRCAVPTAGDFLRTGKIAFCWGGIGIFDVKRVDSLVLPCFLCLYEAME